MVKDKENSKESKPRDVIFSITAAHDGDIIVEDVRISTRFEGESSDTQIFLLALEDHLTASTNANGREVIKLTATDNELRQEAIAAFEEKYEGVELEAQHIRGPFYDRKGMGIPKTKTRKRRTSLQMDHDKVRFGMIDGCAKLQAVYNEWKVTAQYVVNPEECVLNYDPDNGSAVMVMFKEPTNPEEKKKIQPPFRFVLESELKDVEKISA